jgi:alanyl-tRNA synthetase
VTHRLYHDDSYQRRFDGSVVAHVTVKDQPALVLDRTAFYPEAGGQLGDRGTLGGLEVHDTQELEDGRIAHVMTGELPAIDTQIIGELDWARRRQHMAQHTAQHLLSGTLLDRARAATASARLGETTLTIDVTRDRIPDPELAAAEDLANDLIDDDLAIRAWFPDPAELAAMKLRRDPKVSADVRVVAIGDFDFSPCGGTHCARTSQLGSLRIIGSERYKGMTRVSFTAARRTRAELFSRDQVLRGLATLFSCGPAEVPAAIDKLRRVADTAAATLTAVRSQLASAIVQAFPGTDTVIAAIPADPELLRSVAAKLTSAGRDAILTTTEDTSPTVVVFRATGSALDCGALWKRIAHAAGGRGGGRAERAEGRLANRQDDWPGFVAALLTHG